MLKKNRVKLAAAALVTAALPFAVTRAAQNPPDMNRLMAAALDFTSKRGFYSETLNFTNGNLILYKPDISGSISSAAESSDVFFETEAYEKTSASEETEQTYQTSETSYDNPPKESEKIAENPIEEANPFIITQNISKDIEDLSVYKGSDLKVYRNTFRSVNGSNFITLDGGGQIRNCTELDNDFVREQTEIKTDIRLKAFSEEPQVLIMHTHACESYLVGDGRYKDKNYTSRTTDASQNVVAVGKIISQKLAQKGICVIHDGTLHDYPAYKGSYERSEQTVSSILKKYPSIKVVLDIHRDGIVENDGNPIAAVNEINGRPAAQVMIISAASDGYYYVPNYLKNLRFACLIQENMETKNRGITRPVLFQYCQYNQHLSTGSLLLEIGSQGNTLDEALYTGELIGESIGDALLSICE